MLMNSKRFALEIEEIVKSKKISYMDAVVLYCEDNDIDTGTISSLINKSLKEKIQMEAEKLNLVEKSGTATLPV
tara:strand:+ start:510 stop:731 length:222 start_codon:yes stop_codon:yes gene_type:complete